MGLRNCLLKTINPVISGYLTDYFNKIVVESHYPKSCGIISKVVTITKDGDQRSQRRLMSFLLKKKQISLQKTIWFPEQEINSRCLNRNAGKHPEFKGEKTLAHCSPVDLSKAFDTVDLSILQDNCSTYGLRGKIEVLLNSYPKHRKQFVRYKGESSSTKKIGC